MSRTCSTRQRTIVQRLLGCGGIAVLLTVAPLVTQAQEPAPPPREQQVQPEKDAKAEVKKSDRGKRGDREPGTRGPRGQNGRQRPGR